MPNLWIFQTNKSWRFLTCPTIEANWNQRLDRQRRLKTRFLDKLRDYNPEINYPFLGLYRYPTKSESLRLVIPNSTHGALEGPLLGWSYKYDTSTPEGLARKIDEESKKPKTIHIHSNPITCVVDFTRDHPALTQAYSLLADRYGYELNRILL